MNNKHVFEIASDKGLTWRQVADEYNRTHDDPITPNAARKAYKRYSASVEQSVGKIEERKRMNAVRSVVEQTAREYTEKSFMAEAVKAIWGKDLYREDDVQVFFKPSSKKTHGYAFGDTHWGYTNAHPKMTYNIDVARARLWEIANEIVKDVIANGYDEIFIADLGDQIEGSGLRISQLLRIVETMTQQAKGYSDTIISILKWMSKQLPDVKINCLMVSDDNHGQLRLFNTKRDELPDNLAVLITNAVKNAIDTAHEFGGMLNVRFETADEIVLSLGTAEKPFNVCFAHSHQYGRGDDILHKATQRHGMNIHLFIGAHWHTLSIKSKNVVDGCQTGLIFVPPVVGDTDFGEKLFLSTLPGFLKLTIDDRVYNAEQIRLKQ